MQYQLSAQPLRLQGGSQRLCCAEGTIWLTIQGDSNDYFVSAGESLDIAGRAVIVSALGRRAIAEVRALSRV
jgi:hypothetical protein